VKFPNFLDQEICDWCKQPQGVDGLCVSAYDRQPDGTDKLSGKYCSEKCSDKAIKSSKKKRKIKLTPRFT
jgi:hypothetical protein